MAVEFEARKARVVAGKDVKPEALLKALSDAGYAGATIVDRRS